MASAIVDFPDPDSPTRPYESSWPMVNDTPRMASRFLPRTRNASLKSLTSRTGAWSVTGFKTVMADDPPAMCPLGWCRLFGAKSFAHLGAARETQRPHSGQTETRRWPGRQRAWETRRTVLSQLIRPEFGARRLTAPRYSCGYLSKESASPSETRWTPTTRLAIASAGKIAGHQMPPVM